MLIRFVPSDRYPSSELHYVRIFPFSFLSYSTGGKKIDTLHCGDGLIVLACEMITVRFLDL